MDCQAISMPSRECPANPARQSGHPQSPAASSATAGIARTEADLAVAALRSHLSGRPAVPVALSDGRARIRTYRIFLKGADHAREHLTLFPPWESTPMTTQRRQGEHERAVRRDLRRLPREDRTGGLAQLALKLARELDGDYLTPRDLATVSGQFHAVLLTLAKRQEPPAVLDPVDELARRRRERRLGRDAASG